MNTVDQTNMTKHTSPVLLTDSDLDRLTAADAVAWMLEALRERAAGTMISPPRSSADLDDGCVVLTAGKTSAWYGYRVYDTVPTSHNEQSVVIHDAVTGKVVAMHVGTGLGTSRTGALGGAAVNLLGPKSPARVGVVGAGAQARAQLWAASGAIDIAEVRIASRTEKSRDDFVEVATTQLGLPATPVDCARDAVEDADVVIVATNSATPVIESAWLSDDVFVTTVGPKQIGRAEFSPDLIEDADLVVTDSPSQLHAYDPPALATRTNVAGRIVDLASVAAGIVPEARTGRRVYLSVGLSGTEVHLLGRFVGAHYLPPA